MDDARRIENLLYTYAERIDAGDFAGVAELFAHGRVMAAEDAGAEMTFEGRDAVERMYESTTRRYDDGTPKTHHVITNVHVEVEDGADTARARSYFCVLQATDVLPLQPIVTGRYTDTFRRLDGEWVYDTRVMHIDQTGDLSQHLLIDLG